MWFSKSREKVFQELIVNPLTGLSIEQADARIDRHGNNKLKGNPKKV